MSVLTQTKGGLVPDIWTASGVLLETNGTTETSVKGSIGPDAGEEPAVHYLSHFLRRKAADSMDDCSALNF